MFTNDSVFLKSLLEGTTTLAKLGLNVRTGNIVWNQHKDELTNDENETVLIYNTNLTKEHLKTSIGGLPDDIKEIFKKHIDSVFGNKKTAETTDAAALPPLPPSNLETKMPLAPPSEATTAATTDAAALPPPPSKAEEAATEAELEAAAKAGLAGLDGDEKNETINKIMEMLKETGVLEEIKKRICTAAPATTAAPAGGGAKRKHRRKTKKNIRRNKNAKTRFGRTF
jgi:hypothetical protein